MAVTQFAFAAFRNYDRQTPQSLTFAGATFEIKTPSGTSGQTTATASISTPGTLVCRVSTDTAVYVAFGTDPTASSTTGFYLPANSTDVFIVNGGDKGAVITA